MDDPIGAHEKLSYSLPPIGSTEPPLSPKPSTPNTNYWEVALTRKQALVCHSIMVVFLILVMTWSRQTEKNDIAAVRTEQRTYSATILEEISRNNAAAIQRSGNISEGIHQLLGRVDNLTLELTRENTTANDDKRHADGHSP